MCACGEKGSCVEPGLLCNCDKNDEQWRSDEGFITKRNDLPIGKFCAGDTGKITHTVLLSILFIIFMEYIYSYFTLM